MRNKQVCFSKTQNKETLFLVKLKMEKKIKKFLKPLKYLFLIAFALGIFADVFLFKLSLGPLTLLIFALWILTVWLFEFSAKISFYLAFVFLGLTFLLMVFRVAVIPGKAIVWLYLFLFWATAQQLKDLLKDS